MSMGKFVGVLIPIVFGVAAGVLNWLALQKPTYSYVSVATPISAGETFLEDDSQLQELVITTEIQGAIPWSERGLLHGARIPRKFAARDPVLLRDIASPMDEMRLREGEVAINLSLEGVTFEPSLLKVGREVGFAVRTIPASVEDPEAEMDLLSAVSAYRVLGPFRLTSIGQIVNDVDTQKSGSQSPSISVAAELADDGTLSGPAAQLIEANRLTQVRALVIYPPSAGTVQ